MYKLYLVLNNLQWLIRRKNPTNPKLDQTINYWGSPARLRHLVMYLMLCRMRFSLKIFWYYLLLKFIFSQNNEFLIFKKRRHSLNGKFVQYKRELF